MIELMKFMKRDLKFPTGSNIELNQKHDRIIACNLSVHFAVYVIAQGTYMLQKCHFLKKIFLRMFMARFASLVSRISCLQICLFNFFIVYVNIFSR